MIELRCEVVRCVDDEPFPGWVEAQFTDAAGRRWSLFDKPPVFVVTDDLGPESTYPVEATVVCVVSADVQSPEHNGTVTVSTSPHGVMTSDGRDEFTVRQDQLIYVGSLEETIRPTP